ncbi:MAG: cell surface protein SprA, partial [Bacteroidetes bacterium]|nr:cell surface protein SprA [Bacteroidota bacterium]
EWPLEITPNGTIDPAQIWPTENNLNLALEEFYNLKIKRDVSNHPMTQVFEDWDVNTKGRVKVLGNPDLSNLRVIMIGIKNPARDQNEFNTNDDGLPKCGEIWVNELRLTDFNQQGGWAANGRVTAKLADFGQVNVAGQRRTIGFGGLEQTLLERSQEDMRGFDVQSQFALDKFFPENFGLRLPMYYDYSYKQIRPRFNPIQPDVELASTLAAQTPDRRREYLNRVSDIETRRSLNFINVQKKNTKAAKTPLPWSISNFTGTYRYTEVVKSDIYTNYDSTRSHTAILGYNYSFPTVKPITPFKRYQKYKSLKIISDINFNYLPNSMAFQGQVNKRYNTILFRNNDNIESIVIPNYDQTFDFNRTYNFKYDITKSLRFNYSGQARTIFDEPQGYHRIDTLISTIQREDLARLNAYQHSINVNYAVPIDKLPLLDFVKISTDYKGGFNWQGAMPAYMQLGNTISNSANYSANGQFNFIQLYNKNKFLRTLNSNRSNYERVLKEKEKKQAQKEKEERKQNKEIETKPGNDDEVDGEEDEQEKPLINETLFKTMEFGVRALMSVRNVSINYSVTEGTSLPGFMPQPDYLGYNIATGAPGIPFILGKQIDDEEFKRSILSGNWLTTDTTLLQFYARTNTENLTANATLEPFQGFRVTVTANRRYAESAQENFRNNPTPTEPINFESLTPQTTGNFSMSFNSIRTAFINPVLKDGSTEIDFHPLIEQFEDNRFYYSKTLAEERAQRENDNASLNRNGYYAGYGAFQQDVLIPSFLAAYTGADPEKVSTNPFWSIPLPNWRVNYSGLGQIEPLKKYIRSASLNHSYRSTYTISNFISALEYDQDQNILSVLKDTLDYLPQFQIQQISIAEQFGPLAGIDVTWKNNLSTKFEYTKSRTVALNFSNFQVQEMTESAIVIGAGYRTKELKLPFIKIEGKPAILKNDINFRADVSIRDNKQVLYQLDQDVDRTPSLTDTEKDQVTVVSGNRIVNIAPTIDYKISKSLNLRIFYTRNVNSPANSLSFPRRNTNFGFSIRYTLMP